MDRETGTSQGGRTAAFLAWTAGDGDDAGAAGDGRADVLSNGPQLGRLWNRGGGRGAGLQSASSSRTLGCWCRLTESRRAAREKVERPGRGLAGPAGWRAVWKKAVAKGVHCRWELRGAQGGKGLRQSWDPGSTGTPLGRVKAGTAG